MLPDTVVPTQVSDGKALPSSTPAPGPHPPRTPPPADLSWAPSLSGPPSALASAGRAPGPALQVPAGPVSCLSPPVPGLLFCPCAPFACAACSPRWGFPKREPRPQAAPGRGCRLCHPTCVSLQPRSAGPPQTPRARQGALGAMCVLSSDESGGLAVGVPTRHAVVTGCQWWVHAGGHIGVVLGSGASWSPFWEDRVSTWVLRGCGACLWRS